MKQKTLNLIHTIIILAAYSSPLWLDYRLIILGTVIYWAQILIFKACVIAIAQYGGTDTSFSATYIGKALATLGLNISHKRLRFILDWIWPEIVLLVAIYLQVIVGFVPVVGF